MTSLIALARDSGLTVTKERWLNDPLLTPVTNNLAVQARSVRWLPNGLASNSLILQR